MKHIWTFLSVTLVMMVLLSSSSFAGNETIVDDILMIPKAGDAPTIDGQLDDIWNSVTAIPMLIFENHPIDSVASYDDHAATFRTMWDDDNFYVFVSIVDDERDGSEKASPWASDCVELFFDGDNAKGVEYDANDIQWRYVYGEVPGDTANASNGPGVFAFYDTESGYNLEIAISRDSLASRFTLEEDALIGFEISNADRDENVGQQDVLHWWTNDGLTWSNPSLFGTALLIGNEVSDVLNIRYTEDAPTIDGTREDIWDISDEISLAKLEGNALPDTIFATWQDHMASAWTMWDEDNFYVFVNVIDDEIDGSEKASPWASDCVELFFDGDNAKGVEYDTNDIQWRYVYGEVPGDTANASNGPGNFAFAETDLGFSLEIAIPRDTIASRFALETDALIGFEISNADRDNGIGQRSVLHWWTTDGLTWSNPSLFGTALLVGGEGVGVEAKYLDKAADYALEQNYPNPFNPTTTIKYSIADNQSVRLAVYDVVGREVAVLINETQRAGKYSVELNAANLSSGVYFYELRTGNQLFVKKMMLLK